MNRDIILKFLEERGASSITHSGRFFLFHLLGTEKLLQQWGYSVDIQLAGLFHSIYGTNAFKFQNVGLHERALITGLIGEKAERLAYCFCVSKRPRDFLGAQLDLQLTNRHQNERFAITEQERSDLIAIELANLIEQTDGGYFVREVVLGPTTHGRGVRTEAMMAASLYMHEHAKAA